MDNIKIKLRKVENVKREGEVLATLDDIIRTAYIAKPNMEYMEDANYEIFNSEVLKQQIIDSYTEINPVFENASCSIIESNLVGSDHVNNRLPRYSGIVKFEITSADCTVVTFLPDNHIYAYNNENKKIVMMKIRDWEMIVQ